MFENEKLSKQMLVKPLVIGQVVSILSSVVILLVSAIAVTNLDLSDDYILILSLVSMSVGVFAGGIVIAKLLKQKGILCGALNGLIFFVLTTIVAFSINNGAVTIITPIKLALFVVCSIIGGVVGVNLKHKQKLL